jgi:hypothetical protein
MADCTTQSTNAPASEPGTTNNTHNDDKVYMALSYKYDPRDVDPPQCPAVMSVYATPTAKQRVLNSTRGTGGVIASLGTSVQAQNTICPIKGPLLPEAEGNTKDYKWPEWKKQTDQIWTDGLDDYNNRTRGNTGLKMVQVAEPSEAWQKELGVSLVPMGDVYNAVEEGKRKKKRFAGLVYFDAEPARPSVRSRASLAIPTLEVDDLTSDWIFIPQPDVSEDDASNHT